MKHCQLKNCPLSIENLHPNPQNLHPKPHFIHFKQALVKSVLTLSAIRVRLIIVLTQLLNPSTMETVIKHMQSTNSQPGSTAHSRGWKLKGISLGGFALTIVLTLLIGFKGWGQTTVTIPSANTNGTSLNDPFGSFWGYERSAMVYTSAEIGSTGSITSIGFYVNSVSSPGNATNCRIYMKMRTTLMTALSTYASETSGATLVYGPTTISSASFVAGNWVTVALATPFSYTGGSNNLEIIIETNATGTGNETASAKQFRYSNPGSVNYYQYWNADNSAPTGDGTRVSNRPNVQLTFAASCSATTYYSKSTGNLDQTSSWSSTSDGTGCSPANFTTAGVTYIIQQNLAGNATRTIGANWTVSGAGSKVVLGQASAAAVTFTIPNNFAFTGTIDVAAASGGASNTLVLNNSTIPTFVSLDPSSTVKYTAVVNQTISHLNSASNPLTYGNLETGVVSGSTNYTKTAAGALNIDGNLTLGDYTTLALGSYSHTLAGDFIKPTGNGILNAGTSTLTFDGSSTQKIHVTAAGGSTPCDADITYNNLVINGSDVKLYYNQVTNRKMNIVDLTVNASKVLTLFSAP